MGFGAFSKSKADLQIVFNYIKNQELHHSKKSLKDEYVELLEENDVEYKDEYLFD